MRLIDADALRDYIVIHNVGCGCSEDYQKSFLESIYEQPTIEPERKTGKWLCVTDGHYEYFRCSQCGKHSNEPKPFCNVCGIKMEEGDRE